jgi:hypothetical protein
MQDWHERNLSAREIAIRELNSMRGRLLTVIESASLPPRQEKALVTLVKTLSYQNQAVIVELLQRLDPEGERKFVYNDSRLDEQVTV